MYTIATIPNAKKLSDVGTKDLKNMYGFILSSGLETMESTWVLDFDILYKKKRSIIPFMPAKYTGHIKAPHAIKIQTLNNKSNIKSEEILNEISSEIHNMEKPYIIDSKAEAIKYANILNSIFDEIHKNNKDSHLFIHTMSVYDILNKLDPNMDEYLTTRKPQSL